MPVLIGIGAAALLAGAAVHLAQLVTIFHAVPWIGPLFAADAAAATTVAVALLVTRRPLAAAAGGLISAGALAGLALSSTVGLFGWTEGTLRPSVVIAIAAELVAIAALAPLALPLPADRGGVRWRAATAIALLAVAVLHVAAAGEEWQDARGVFWLFMALAGGCAALAVRLGLGRDRAASAAVLALAVVPMAGFLVSRTTGLPGATDDIGDWANPLGLAALAVEAALVVLAARPRFAFLAGDIAGASATTPCDRWRPSRAGASPLYTFETEPLRFVSRCRTLRESETEPIRFVILLGALA